MQNFVVPNDSFQDSGSKKAQPFMRGYGYVQLKSTNISEMFHWQFINGTSHVLEDLMFVYREGFQVCWSHVEGILASYIPSHAPCEYVNAWHSAGTQQEDAARSIIIGWVWCSLFVFVRCLRIDELLRSASCPSYALRIADNSSYIV